MTPPDIAALLRIPAPRWRVEIKQQAAPGTRYSQTAADRAVGEPIRVNLNGHRLAGTIAAARVLDDGQALLLTLDVTTDISEEAQ